MKIIHKMRKFYKINLKSVVWGAINRRVLLIKLENKHIFELKNAGLDIWKMIIKNCDSQKIIINLSQKYSLSRKVAKTDFSKFIKQLKKEDIIYEIR